MSIIEWLMYYCGGFIRFLMWCVEYDFIIATADANVWRLAGPASDYAEGALKRQNGCHWLLYVCLRPEYSYLAVLWPNSTVI